MNVGINIDLYSRYQTAFGHVAKLGFTETHKALLRSNMTLYSKSVNSQNESSGITLFERGDATFADIELKNSKTNTIVKFGITKKNELLEGVLAPPPMVSFSRSKNIKTTIIDNSDYQVVESFGTTSWSINFEVILVDVENHWYPSDLLKQIRKLFEVNDTFVIIGDVFSDLGIQELYFTDLNDLSFVDGYNDTVKCKLVAKSIKPTEFFI